MSNTPDNENVNTTVIGSMTPEQSAQARDFSVLIEQAVQTSLGMVLDSDLQTAQPKVAEYGDLEELTEEIIPQGGVFAQVDLDGECPLQTVIFLSTSTTFKMAGHLMGGGSGSDNGEIGDIELGAVGEVLSQTMSSAANAIHSHYNKSVEPGAPNVSEYALETMFGLFPDMAQNRLTAIKVPITHSAVLGSDVLVTVVFLCDEFKTQLKNLNIRGEAPEALKDAMNALSEGKAEGYASSPMQMADPDAAMAHSTDAAAAGGTMAFTEHPAMADAMQTAGVGAHSHMASMGMGDGGAGAVGGDPVTVQPVAFPSFDNHLPAAGMLNGNLDLLLDVQLNLTVELGRSELSIKDVLELTRGSVIELNRVAGEAVDLFANGKMIAKGEVVVIEDNFGLRITSIVSPAERIKAL
ncbi:MAG: flagellar motor switch protein FliN [Vampirovibrionales bacterium]